MAATTSSGGDLANVGGLPVTRIVPATSGLDAAVELLRAGEVVAFPTETVYGLGADARETSAVKKIYVAKGRPAGNPIIVHVATVEEARACAATWPEVAEVLAERFWPGPLTLIVARGKSLTPLVSAGRTTVALRCPNHPVAQALLRAFGGPIAAPSANRSGFTSPTTAPHVFAELSGRIPMVLDGGPSTIGLESTVLDLSAKVPTIVRPGAITINMLRLLIPDVQLQHTTVRVEESAISPGLHHRHYAPRARAYRFVAADWPRVRQWAGMNKPVALLSHDEEITLPAPHETILMPAVDADYARTLYAALREADVRSPRAILVLEPAEDGGLWHAIADRLHRATEPFPAA
jgi:L-threonylcarbamoyladenylate synthase